HRVHRRVQLRAEVTCSTADPHRARAVQPGTWESMPESIRAARTALWGAGVPTTERTEIMADAPVTPRSSMPTPIALSVVTDAPPSSAPTRNAMAETAPMTTQDPPLPPIPPPPKPEERGSLPKIPPRPRSTRAWEHDLPRPVTSP